MIIKESLDSGIKISVKRATHLLCVSRCGFYKWLRRSKREAVDAREDTEIRNEIQKIALEFPGYGYRRITAELRRRGYTVNHKRVLRLMREDNLLCVRKVFKPRTTDSSHNLRIYPNLIKNLEITNRIKSGLPILPTYGCMGSSCIWQSSWISSAGGVLGRIWTEVYPQS